MKLKPGILPPDYESRDRIVTDLNTNFFVEASAGSGKTTVLIDRMAALILSGEPISRISTITFTKAAANEFYKRFHKKLNDLLDRTDGEARRRVDEALRNIDLCFMGTIDSFCNMILNEHPSRAGVPSKVKVLQGADWDRVICREYKQMLSGSYGSAVRDKALSFNRMFDYAEDTFLTVMRELLTRSSYEFRCPSAPTAQQIQTRFHKFAAGLGDLCGLLNSDVIVSKMSDLKKYGKFKSALSILGELDLAQAASPGGTYIYDHFREFAAALSSLNGFKFTLKDDFMLSFRPAVFPPSVDSWISRNATAEKILAGGSGKTTGVTFTLDFGDIENPDAVFDEMKFSLAMDFCLSVKDQLYERLRKNGELSFNSCLCAVRDMLKRDAACEGSPLIRHITERHRFYLIDEFQDTDPLQYEIFFYLAAGENAVPDWEKCVPLPGSLFIVGDPKQSIYSFKGADAAAFIKVRELFEGAGENDPRAVLRLTFNFRSSPELCAYFDQQFTSLLGPGTYSPIRTEGDSSGLLTPEAEGLFHGCFRLVPPARVKGSKEDMCITAIADIISAVTDSGEHLICPDPAKPPRRISYDDFMIITKNKAMTDLYRAELEQRGIPVFVEGTCSFETSRALGALTTLLYAVDDPRDSRAVVPALLGPVFGFSESDLAEEGRTKGKIPGKFASLIKEKKLSKAIGNDDLRAALNKLRELSRKAARMIPSAVICLVSDELKLFSVMGSGGMKYYYYALELVRSAEAAGTLTSLRQAADMLKRMISDSDGIERCLSLSESEKGVHIANLHKVKGLEKPIVFLAAKQSNKFRPVRNSISVSLVTDADGKRFPYVFNIQKKLGGNYFNLLSAPEDSPGYEEYMQQAVDAELAEKKRQQYVAATRAECTLIICDTDTDPDTFKEEEKLLSAVWKALIKGSTLITPGTELLALKPEQDITGLVSEDLSYAGSSYSSKDIAAGAEPEHPFVLPSNAAVKPSSLNGSGTAQSQEEQDDPDDDPEEPEDEQDEQDEAEETATPEPEPEPAVSLIPGNVKGRLIHSCMEYLILSRGAAAADPALLAERVTDEIGSYFDDDQRSESLAMLTAAIGRMTSDGYPQQTAAPKDLLSELFTEGTEEIYCELPFVYTDKTGSIVSGVIDLLYRRGSEWHIIDYKTNHDAKDLEKDPVYAAQLACYSQAVTDMKLSPGETVDAHIYHIKI